MDKPDASTEERLTFLEQQRSLHKDCPANLWQRYRLYVECVWDMPGHVATFQEWVTR